MDSITWVCVGSDGHCNIPYSVDVDGMRHELEKESIYGRNDLLLLSAHSSAEI